MNKQIKELTKRAGFVLWKNEAWNPGDTVDWSCRYDDELEKFAELIVKECAEQIISKGTDWVDFAPSQTGVRPEYWNMAQQIKQHFGVEE